MQQDELAQSASVSLATLWRLETGRPATLETVRKLATALQVEPGELMRPARGDIRGLRLRHPQDRQPCCHDGRHRESAWFKDPDGNILALFQPE